jgi:hypothetical protein
MDVWEQQLKLLDPTAVSSVAVLGRLARRARRADEAIEPSRVMSPIGTNRTSSDVRSSVAIGGKADMAATSADFRV